MLALRPPLRRFRHDPHPGGHARECGCFPWAPSRSAATGAPGRPSPSRRPRMSPRDMTGHLAVLARLPGGCRGRHPDLSDATGSTGRQLTIVGDHGRKSAPGDPELRADRPPGEANGPSPAPPSIGGGFVDLIVWQWSRLLQRTATWRPPRRRMMPRSWPAASPASWSRPHGPAGKARQNSCRCRGKGEFGVQGLRFKSSAFRQFGVPRNLRGGFRTPETLNS